MNRLINLIGGVVLCGILVKLSYVFVYLFDQLDGGGVVARVTGVTFAFASIYLVVKVRQRWLKATVVLLDVSTILYYYLHDLLQVNIAYASFIVAAYSGIIVYYLGRIVSEAAANRSESVTKRERILEERLRTVNEASTRREQILEDRLRIGNELQAVEREMARVQRCLRESKGEATIQRHNAALKELEARKKELQEKFNLLK